MLFESSNRDVTASTRNILCTGLVAGILALPAAALAGPTGGVVNGGNAQIQQSGSVTTIDQSSAKALIDWRSFNVGASETVNFLQPSAQAITLNRVHSATPSQIDGAVNANGNIWVINPSGVLIGRTARVNTGGFIATTANIDKDAFLAGDYRFDQPGDPNASVVNEGLITFGEAGFVGLVGPTARNDGVIAGQLGRVVIQGSDAFAVDLAGDGIIALPTGQATELAAINTGQITNDGGYILIDAATADSVLRSTVTNEGVIEATTFRQEGGRIFLSGDEARIGGTIEATGGSTDTGGNVTITGDRILLEDATIDVSGGTGGGEVRIGGDVGGGPTLPQAVYTVVDEDSSVLANSTVSGDGGLVVFWSTDGTGFYGDVAARGGPSGGNGGFIEISGGFLDAQGAINLDAPLGDNGTLLFDPVVILIQSSGPGAGTVLGPLGFNIFAADAGAFDSQTTVITPEFITSVNGTTLILEARQRIEVNETVDNRSDAEFSSDPENFFLDLKLRAGLEIEVNADLQIVGDITLETGVDFGDGFSSDDFVGVTIDPSAVVQEFDARIDDGGDFVVVFDGPFAPTIIENSGSITELIDEVGGTPTITEIVNNEVIEDETELTVPFIDLLVPVFSAPEPDFATLFSATGNENLWSVGACPPSGIIGQNLTPDCEIRSGNEVDEDGQ